MEQTLILINPYCHQGRGWKRWTSIRDEVRSKIAAPLTQIVLERGVRFEDSLHPSLQENKTSRLISAGGDGSIHFLLNYLMNEQKNHLSSIKLGAIGLGSSNDFLKPFAERIQNIPVRINFGSDCYLHDVGVVSYLDAANNRQTKYFIVNASIGITAEANWRFNHPDALLRFLKKTMTQGAILYTAVNTILQFKNISVTLAYNKKIKKAPISNINVLKVPYVSGSFYYDQQIARDDGRLAVNACLDMSKGELLSILFKLQKGQFPTTAKTLTDFSKEITIQSEEAFVFECDGETEKSKAVHLSIIPTTLLVAKN